MTPRERAYAVAMLWFPDKEPDNMQVAALAAHVELALKEHVASMGTDITAVDWKERAERAEKINSEYADARKWDLEALKSRLQRQEMTERERDAEKARADAAERELAAVRRKAQAQAHEEQRDAERRTIEELAAAKRDLLSQGETIKQVVLRASNAEANCERLGRELEATRAESDELRAGIQDHACQDSEAYEIAMNMIAQRNQRIAELEAENDRSEAFAEMIVGMLVNVGHDYGSDCWECRDLAKSIADRYADDSSSNRNDSGSKEKP